ncbi:MAG TPA: ABC transporter permease, partial [Burkholderiales bacterium]|nr:ABC transporter permease [Burkholderiales bacterium]
MKAIAILRNARVAFGALVVLAIIVSAIGAPWLSTHDPLEQDLLNSFQSPGVAGGDHAHPLGTDSLGRDILAR